MDYVTEDLTEEKKAIVGLNHYYSGGEKEAKPLNSGSSGMVRLLLSETRKTSKKEGTTEFKNIQFKKTGRYFVSVDFKEIIK